MGGVIILATVGKDRSVTNCALAIIAVSLMHTMVAALKIRFPKFGAAIGGTPLVLLDKGVWKQEVMAAARTKGVKSIHDVRYAILERNGAISVIQKEK